MPTIEQMENFTDTEIGSLIKVVVQNTSLLINMITKLGIKVQVVLLRI